MRQILFRGKRDDNGEWIEGYPVFYSMGFAVINDGCQGGRHVLPDTVNEYTGRTDRNDKKIFEGDVVEVEGETGLFEVVWKEEIAAFVLRKPGLYAGFDCYFDWQFTVIGNIYDNPELMGGD